MVQTWTIFLLKQAAAASIAAIAAENTMAPEERAYLSKETISVH